MRLCFVLLAAPKLPQAKRFTKALQEFPELGKAQWPNGGRNGIDSLSIGGIEVVTGLMPAPIAEADAATDRSLSGLQGSWTLPEHHAHLVVTQVSEDSSLESLTTFTRVIAAMVRATDAVGVYWGEAGATHHPEFVVDLAKSDLPLPLWVGVSIAKEKSGISLLSMGMKQLELPELLLSAPMPDGGALQFFYELLAYVARTGQPIPDGETVGRTEKEKLKVRYVPSPLDENSTVWNVRLPKTR